MPCAGVVPDIVPTGFVRVADVFRPLPQGPKRCLRGFRASALGFEAVYWESVHCGDASSACPPGLPWRLRSVQHQGYGQAQHASWSKWFPGLIRNLRLLRTSLCTAFRQSARAAAAAPSSNFGWQCFQQIGAGPVLGPGLGSSRKLWRLRSCSASTRDVALVFAEFLDIIS